LGGGISGIVGSGGQSEGGDSELRFANSVLFSDHLRLLQPHPRHLATTPRPNSRAFTRVGDEECVEGGSGGGECGALLSQLRSQTVARDRSHCPHRLCSCLQVLLRHFRFSSGLSPSVASVGGHYSDFLCLRPRSLHCPSNLHSTTPHTTPPHHTTLHSTPPHHTTPHHTPLHHTSPHSTPLLTIRNHTLNIGTLFRRRSVQ